MNEKKNPIAKENAFPEASSYQRRFETDETEPEDIDAKRHPEEQTIESDKRSPEDLEREAEAKRNRVA